MTSRVAALLTLCAVGFVLLSPGMALGASEESLDAASRIKSLRARVERLQGHIATRVAQTSREQRVLSTLTHRYAEHGEELLSKQQRIEAEQAETSAGLKELSKTGATIHSDAVELSKAAQQLAQLQMVLATLSTSAPHNHEHVHALMDKFEDSSVVSEQDRAELSELSEGVREVEKVAEEMAKGEFSEASAASEASEAPKAAEKPTLTPIPHEELDQTFPDLRLPHASDPFDGPELVSGFYGGSGTSGSQVAPHLRFHVGEDEKQLTGMLRFHSPTPGVERVTGSVDGHDVQFEGSFRGHSFKFAGRYEAGKLNGKVEIADEGERDTVWTLRRLTFFKPKEGESDVPLNSSEFDRVRAKLGLDQSQTPEYGADVAQQESSESQEYGGEASQTPAVEPGQEQVHEAKPVAERVADARDELNRIKQGLPPKSAEPERTRPELTAGNEALKRHALHPGMFRFIGTTVNTASGRVSRAPTIHADLYEDHKLVGEAEYQASAYHPATRVPIEGRWFGNAFEYRETYYGRCFVFRGRVEDGHRIRGSYSLAGGSPLGSFTYIYTVFDHNGAQLPPEPAHIPTTEDDAEFLKEHGVAGVEEDKAPSGGGHAPPTIDAVAEDAEKEATDAVREVTHEELAEGHEVQEQVQEHPVHHDEPEAQPDQDVDIFDSVLLNPHRRSEVGVGLTMGYYQVMGGELVNRVTSQTTEAPRALFALHADGQVTGVVHHPRTSRHPAKKVKLIGDWDKHSIRFVETYFGKTFSFVGTLPAGTSTLAGTYTWHKDHYRGEFRFELKRIEFVDSTHKRSAMDNLAAIENMDLEHTPLPEEAEFHAAPASTHKEIEHLLADASMLDDVAGDIVTAHHRRVVGNA